MTNRKTLKVSDNKSLLKKALRRSRQQRPIVNSSANKKPMDALLMALNGVLQALFAAIQTEGEIRQLADQVLDSIPTIPLQEAFIAQLELSLAAIRGDEVPPNSEASSTPSSPSGASEAEDSDQQN